MKPKNKGGRPRKEIDFKQLEALCSIQCTKEEICSVLFITDKTLDRLIKEQYNTSFSEVYKKNSGVGKSSLRRWQFDAAKKGNTSMLIWLGKQYLGQTDNGVVTPELVVPEFENWDNAELKNYVAETNEPNRIN